MTFKISNHLFDSSLMKLLAIPLSQQAGKWLVIPRRRESNVCIQHAFRFGTCFARSFFLLDSRLRGNDDKMSSLK
jgi:hypothetical protein